MGGNSDLTGPVAFALLLAVNFSLAVAGLMLPFAAVRSDRDAPWADEMQIFAWVGLGLGLAAVLAGAGLGLYHARRGRPEVLFAASVAALTLPFAAVAGYLWYLFNVVEATISGPVGVGMLLLSGTLVMLGFCQAIAAIGIRLIRSRSRQSPRIDSF